MKKLFEFDAFIKETKKGAVPRRDKVYAPGRTVEEALAEIAGFTEQAVFTGKASVLSKDWQC